MKRLFLIFIVFFCSHFFVKAQSSTATGCLLQNNIIYTDDYTFTNYFKTSSINTLPANRCSWTPVTGPTCYVSASRSFDVFGCFCYVYASPQTGFSGTFTASTIGCPLDDYIWFLIFPIGILGILYLRKHITNKFEEALIL
jgi:hypothetical protein